MFGTSMDKNAQFAAIEADLISAHAMGDKHLHAEIYNKFAALIEDEHDIEAALDGLADLANPPKVAVGGFGSFGAQQAQSGGMMGGDLMGMLAKAVMIAGPIIAGAKFLGAKADHDRALQTTQMAYPQMFQQNPARANALFEAIYSSAPNIGKNTILMGDLLKQLMSMPMVDMGTIARLTEISKNTAQKDQGGILNNISDMSKKMTESYISSSMKPSTQPPMKPSMFRADFKSASGQPTVFNWGSEAAKLAGLTDAFTGSGTNMEQANQATMMNQQQSGSSMLPLDSVLHELLMKEMELQQREQTIMQQEQQLQQAMQAVQHIGSQYQGETGVDPNTGAPAQEAIPEAAPTDMPAEQPPQMGAPEDDSSTEQTATTEGEVPAGNEVPFGEEAPVEGEMPPAEGDESTEEAPVPDEEQLAEEPAMEEQIPEESPAPGEEQLAEEPAMEEQIPEESPAPSEEQPAEDPAAALPPAVDMSPEAVAAGEAGLADAATPMGPADEAHADDGMRPEAGVQTDPFSLDYAEGSSIPTAEGEIPAEGEAPADGETPPEDSALPPAEMAAENDPNTVTNPEAEAEPTEGAGPDQHDMPTIEAGESEGPNTAESIEGTPEDEMHDAANGVEEGTPEDEVADKELAAVLNAGGHVAGEGEEEKEEVPADGQVMEEPAPVPEMLQEVPPAMPAPVPVAPPTAPQAQPTTNGHEIILPLRITVKIGEIDPLVAMRQDAEMLRRVALLNLPH